MAIGDLGKSIYKARWPLSPGECIGWPTVPDRSANRHRTLRRRRRAASAAGLGDGRCTLPASWSHRRCSVAEFAPSVGRSAQIVLLRIFSVRLASTTT